MNKMSGLDSAFKKPQHFGKKGRANGCFHKVYGSHFAPSASTSFIYANPAQPDKAFNTTQVMKSRNESQEGKWLVELGKGLRSYNSAASLHSQNGKSHKRCNSIKSVYLPVCFK